MRTFTMGLPLHHSCIRKLMSARQARNFFTSGFVCYIHMYTYKKNELKSDLEMLIHLAKRSCKGSFLSEVPGPHSILLRFYY